MGLLAIVLVVLTLLAAAAAAHLPAPAWFGWLRVTLVLAPATLVAVVGWAARRRLSGEGHVPLVWCLAPAGLGALLAGASLAFGPGPGLLAPVPGLSIDLGAWALSGAGLAGAVLALVFGVVATAAPDSRAALAGALLCAAGFLSLEPLLASLGLPVIGPVGLGLAALVVALARRLRRSGTGGSRDPDPR